MPLQTGVRLGHYEVRAALGAGGMGEVYRAHDARLGRDVAIKVLPEALRNTAEGLARFEREARVLAALSHPNLLAIFDVGTEQGVSFAVMEYLDGETLRERLQRAPPPIGNALEIGAAVAEGLAVAHANAVVHRDLKPDNIFLTTSGQVKILDFGLARCGSSTSSASRRSGGDEGAVAVTTPYESGLTEVGRVMGTVGYMPPEQIRGEIPDGRGDIFSLGCVLYELATGRRAFPGNSPVEIMAAVLRDDPAPFGAPSTPSPRSMAGAGWASELRQVVLRCLAKQPERRFQSASDLAFALGSLRSRADEDLPTPNRLPASLWGRIPPPDPGSLGHQIGGDASSRFRNRPSVAVLPLQNLSPHKQETEYLVDGMTEALIADLAKIRSLRVVSRTSVMQYKDTRKPLREIARELAADAVVEGSVFYAAPQVRITIQLIRAETDEHLWAESYQRELRDLLLLQSEVARAVAQEVNAALLRDEQGLEVHVRSPR